MRIVTRFFFAGVVVVLVGCAQVPKESVELSTTVGRDMTTTHKAHRDLAKLLFSRMRQDINRFVDNVYTPYQIRTVMEKEAGYAKSLVAQDRGASILLAINNAFKPDASVGLQDSVLEAMGYMVSSIHEDIDTKRKELLDPIDQQEATVLRAVDRSYTQMIYANSIVTGYLASIVRVHDAQNELLNAVGVDADLNSIIGNKLATTSDQVGKLVTKAEKIKSDTTSIAKDIAQIKASISGK